MGAVYDTLVNISTEHDEEMLDGFRRYEEALNESLTQEQLQNYADYVQSTGEVRIFDEMTPAEVSSLPPGVREVVTMFRQEDALVTANNEVKMENRRVVALLSQRGEDELTPDFE